MVDKEWFTFQVRERRMLQDFTRLLRMVHNLKHLRIISVISHSIVSDHGWLHKLKPWVRENTVLFVICFKQWPYSLHLYFGLWSHVHQRYELLGLEAYMEYSQNTSPSIVPWEEFEEGMNHRHHITLSPLEFTAYHQELAFKATESSSTGRRHSAGYNLQGRSECPGMADWLTPA
jgi:hypothetical protein